MISSGLSFVIHFSYQIRKNSDTPIQDMTAPMIPFALIGVLKSQCDGRMIRIGVSAISVLAMPAAVNWTAISESATPMNGPKMTATSIADMPFLSCDSSHHFFKSLLRRMTSAKQMKPVIHLIMFEANGTMLSIPVTPDSSRASV